MSRAGTWEMWGRYRGGRGEIWASRAGTLTRTLTLTLNLTLALTLALTLTSWLIVPAAAVMI